MEGKRSLNSMQNAMTVSITGVRTLANAMPSAEDPSAAGESAVGAAAVARGGGGGDTGVEDEEEVAEIPRTFGTLLTSDSSLFPSGGSGRLAGRSEGLTS